MALHLNLNHEIQKQRRQRRRDPLKLGMLALLVIGAGFFFYYFVRLSAAAKVTATLAQMQAQWQTLEPQEKEAKAREEVVTLAQKTAETLIARIEGRFYWGPVLELVQQVVPPEVQLTSFEGDYSKDLKGRGIIRLQGISAGPDPRKVADDLRSNLQAKFSDKFNPAVAKFGSLEDGPKQVQLNGKSVATAAFNITLELSHGETVAPPSVPVRQRRKIGP